MSVRERMDARNKKWEEERIAYKEGRGETRYLNLFDMCHAKQFNPDWKGHNTSRARALNQLEKAGYDLPILEKFHKELKRLDFIEKVSRVHGVSYQIASTIYMGIKANQVWKENESKVTEDLDSLPLDHYWEYRSGYIEENDTPCKFTLKELNEGFETYLSNYGRHSKKLYKYTMMSFLDHTLCAYLGHGDPREYHSSRESAWCCWEEECMPTWVEGRIYFEAVSTFGEYT